MRVPVTGVNDFSSPLTGRWKSMPYYCPACEWERGCGFRGQLVFPDDDEPMCDHHKDADGLPHPVPMVPSSVKWSVREEVRAL